MAANKIAAKGAGDVSDRKQVGTKKTAFESYLGSLQGRGRSSEPISDRTLKKASARYNGFKLPEDIRSKASPKVVENVFGRKLFVTIADCDQHGWQKSGVSAKQRVILFGVDKYFVVFVRDMETDKELLAKRYDRSDFDTVSLDTGAGADAIYWDEKSFEATDERLREGRYVLEFATRPGSSTAQTA